MPKKLYRVTDAAGPWVAGRKVKVGDVLELSEGQAEYEALRGLLEPVGAAQIAAAQPQAGEPRRKGRAAH